jgi:hypothetical protein
MRSFPRFATRRGLGPNENELTDADIVESDGVVPRTPLTCPPRALNASSKAPMRYSYVAPRRETVSIAAAVDAASGTRQKTLRPGALET